MNDKSVGNLTPVLQENSKLFNGVNTVLFKNIRACSELRNLVSSSFGPEGLNKIIQLRSGSSVITSDTATIVENLEFLHPASKILALYSITQEKETGDNAGFVILFATELLNKTQDLIKQGFDISKIIESFEEASEISTKLLENMAQFKISNIKDVNVITSFLCMFVDFGRLGIECYLAPQIAYACIKTSSWSPKVFSVDNVRIIKILGGNFNQIKTIAGIVLIKDTEGQVKNIKKAKLAVFLCDFINISLESKNSTVFNSSDELLSYSKEENYNIEQKIMKFSEIGVNVIISSGFCDVSLFYLDKYNIMALKIQSRFDIKRITKAFDAGILTKIRIPLPQEIGKCDSISVRTLGMQKITIFRQTSFEDKIFTIIARANSTVLLDNIERIVYKAISTFKTLSKDDRLVPGAGTSEIEVSRKLTHFCASNYSNYKQYLISKFAESFDSIPRILTENSTYQFDKVSGELYHNRVNEKKHESINIEPSLIIQAKKSRVWDLFTPKYWAIKYAVEAVLTLLTISQIIMAKKN